MTDREKKWEKRWEGWRGLGKDCAGQKEAQEPRREWGKEKDRRRRGSRPKMLEIVWEVK